MRVPTTRTPPVVVLFGGSSSERRVSVASAQSVVRELPEAELWFLAPGGEVHAGDRRRLFALERPFEEDLVAEGPRIAANAHEALERSDPTTVFFLALHGGEGENGELQRVLEHFGRAFTGSGSMASARAFDKSLAKEAAARAGLRVASGRLVSGSEQEMEATLTSLFRARGSLVAKPVADGSSIGLRLVHDEAAIPSAARAIATHPGRYLVEDFIEGIELTVGVVDERGRTASLPASEVRVERGRAFDFAGKYLGRGVRELTPARVPRQVALEARRAAATAHRALGCEGYSRTDLIAARDGVVFLETNTLPGLTRASFLPQQLAASGRRLRSFLENQIELAIARRDRHPRSTLPSDSGQASRRRA